MKQYLYLDNDVVNSIIAQADDGLISQMTTEAEDGKKNTTSDSTTEKVIGSAGVSVLDVIKAKLGKDIQNIIETESMLHSSSRELITKTLHDAAFDIVYDKIQPIKIKIESDEFYESGTYVEINRIFDVIDLEYLENIFTGSIMELIKKSEREKVEASANEITKDWNHDQRRSNTSKIRAEIKKAFGTIEKESSDPKMLIGALRQLIPYNRMLISFDGYLIPLDDKYFRINPNSLGFKYGGNMTCVGVITNIIGEDTDPNDKSNFFATLQYQGNEMLRNLLPTREKNLYVIHPVAVFYGR